MWTIIPQDAFERAKKAWLKRHRKELMAVLNNLDTLTKALESDTRIQQAKQSYGFIHHEPDGVIAIDQKGAGGHSKEARLYIYVVSTTKRIYLLRIGDEGTQREDIRQCSEWVKAFRSNQR